MANSFAHRAYHGLPKSILRSSGEGGGAILGFANFLLRLYQTRAVAAPFSLAGIRSPRRPVATKAFSPFQPRRHFDGALVDQLDVLPDFVTAVWVRQRRKRLAMKRMTSWRRRWRMEGEAGGTAIVASGDRDAFSWRPRLPPSFTLSALEKWRASVQRKCASGMASSRSRCPTSSRCEAIPRTSSPARPALGRREPRCC